MTQDLADPMARLQGVLEAEEDLYRRMKALLQREEEEIVALDPVRLDQTLAEKRIFAEEGKLLEESRLIATQALAQVAGLGEAPDRLSDLIEFLGPEAGLLPDVHARLSVLVESTRSLLASNERFANRSLTRVRDTLGLLGQAVPVDVGYGPGRSREARAGRGRLVRQAI